jgi:hypothetical protein
VALTTSQVSALETDDISELTTDQVVALTTAQVKALTTAQVAALISDQVVELTTTQVKALTTSQVRALETDDISALTTTQILSMTTAQLCALTSSQIGAMNQNQVAVLPQFTPLVLDRNGDGVRTQSIVAGVRFDLDGDGFAEPTGWPSKDDALLVRDIDGNGQISSGQELFGQTTLLRNGSRARDGFEALQSLDSNMDGLIDGRDVAFSGLMLWQDSDGDGVSQPGELRSLADSSVSKLSLFAKVDARSDNGNRVGLVASYSASEGGQGELADVWFATFGSAASDPATVLVDILDRYGEAAFGAGTDPQLIGSGGPSIETDVASVDMIVAALGDFNASSSVNALQGTPIANVLAITRVPDDPRHTLSNEEVLASSGLGLKP